MPVWGCRDLADCFGGGNCDCGWKVCTLSGRARVVVLVYFDHIFLLVAMHSADSLSRGTRSDIAAKSGSAT